MKKLLVLVAALTLCSCIPQAKNNVHKEYAKFIAQELKAEDWRYTYQEIEPKENEAHIVDFYVLDGVPSQSHWYCVREGGEIDCDMLWIKHLG